MENTEKERDMIARTERANTLEIGGGREGCWRLCVRAAEMHKPVSTERAESMHTCMQEQMETGR